MWCSAGPSLVWIRRCAACDHADLDAMFGRPELADDGWRCTRCSTTGYVLDRAHVP